MNIREVTPCIDCLRNCHPVTPDADGARKAGAYLLANAVEASNSEIPLPEEIQNDANEITGLGRARGITTRALGMISLCGKQIGAENCVDWQLDAVQMMIERKTH